MVKNLPANAGDTRLILGLGRSPGGGHGNPLQCSCLENPMDCTQFLKYVHAVFIEVEHKRTPGVFGVSGIK